MSIAELRAFEQGKVHPIAHARRKAVRRWLAGLDRRLSPMTVAAVARVRAEMPEYDAQSAARPAKAPQPILGHAMRLAFLRRLACGGSSWRALSVGLGPITPEQYQRVIFVSGRALGLIRAR